MHLDAVIRATACLFVCLFNQLFCVETHLGPDGTRLEQSAQVRLKKAYMHTHD